MTAQHTHPATAERKVLPAEKPAPRGPDDEPWEHPADGGPPIDDETFWRHEKAFGSFQGSDEFPDDVAQAMRAVYEKMYRAGVRDWELEWDYVDCSYWSLRRALEVNAREAFRLWYGDARWREPFRLACHLQESGEVEYRIDHLIRAELGVAVRKREKPPDEIRPQVRQEGAPTRRRARYGELQADLLKLAPAFLKRGEPLSVSEIGAMLRERVEYIAHDLSVAYNLARHPEMFTKLTHRDGDERTRVRYAIR